MSPYDEFAVEEALRLKEKNAGSTVTVISAGPARVVETIRTALAMGADNGIHIELPETADNNMAAKALAGALKKEAKVDIIFTGKEAIDDGAAQTSQLTAEYFGHPLRNRCFERRVRRNSIKCKREIEGGAFEMVEITFPALIAAQKGLNEPRYASLPNIMKAKKKEVKAMKAADVGVTDADQKIKLQETSAPAPKTGRKENRWRSCSTSKRTSPSASRRSKGGVKWLKSLSSRNIAMVV